MSAITDSSSKIEVSKAAWVTNLLNIYSSFNNESPEAIAENISEKGMVILSLI